MFISKARHLETIKHFEDSMDLMRCGYISQIKVLEARIQDLHSLVFPKNSSGEISNDQREVDSIISASEKPIEISEEEHNRLLEESREADLLFSGNYSEDLVG